MTTYQVKDWGKHFENYKSRERDACRFVCMPNKQHGMGLMRILSSANGHALFGIWCLMAQKLSRQTKPRNGWMTDDGLPDSTPWELTELAFQWRTSADLLQTALGVFSDPKVGWVAMHEMGGVYTQGDTFDAEVPRSVAKVPRASAEVPRGGSETPYEGMKEGRQKTGSQAVVLDWRKYRPANLPRGLHATWSQIASSHGGPIANTALEAARRIYGATFNHGQLSAVYQAAHRNDVLELLATYWPDPNAKVERPDAADTFKPMAQAEQDQIITELAAQGVVTGDGDGDE